MIKIIEQNKTKENLYLMQMDASRCKHFEESRLSNVASLMWEGVQLSHQPVEHQLLTNEKSSFNRSHACISSRVKARETFCISHIRKGPVIHAEVIQLNHRMLTQTKRNVLYLPDANGCIVSQTF